MCLIVLAYNVVPDSPIILAGNRDEFYNRPTINAHTWSTNPPLIAGKDKKAGGTWLGITKTGRLAAITNYRDINNIRENAPSRGHLVKDALLTPLCTRDYLTHLKKTSSLYNGFNLISGSKNALFYFNNIRQKIEEVPPGVHVISNAFLNTPWPKAAWVQKSFKSLLKSSNTVVDAVFDIFLNQQTYPKESLPKTGLSPEMEKAMSSAFIQTDNYGTRCSTFIRLKNNGKYYFEERNFKTGTTTILSRKIFEGFFTDA